MCDAATTTANTVTTVSSSSFLPALEPDTMPALLAAAFRGDVDECVRALDSGEDPNEASAQCRGFTPLMLAALSGERGVPLCFP